VIKKRGIWCANNHIESRRENEDNFYLPKTENGEVVTEQMNLSHFRLLKIHGIGDNSQGHRKAHPSYWNPRNLLEQYHQEELSGLRAVSSIDYNSNERVLVRVHVKVRILHSKTILY